MNEGSKIIDICVVIRVKYAYFFFMFLFVYIEPSVNSCIKNADMSFPRFLLDII